MMMDPGRRKPGYFENCCGCFSSVASIDICIGVCLLICVGIIGGVVGGSIQLAKDPIFNVFIVHLVGIGVAILVSIVFLVIILYIKRSRMISGLSGPSTGVVMGAPVSYAHQGQANFVPVAVLVTTNQHSTVYSSNGGVVLSGPNRALPV
jgi:hypothetical protein